MTVGLGGKKTIEIKITVNGSFKIKVGFLFSSQFYFFFPIYATDAEEILYRQFFRHQPLQVSISRHR